MFIRQKSDYCNYSIRICIRRLRAVILALAKGTLSRQFIDNTWLSRGYPVVSQKLHWLSITGNIVMRKSSGVNGRFHKDRLDYLYSAVIVFQLLPCMAANNYIVTILYNREIDLLQ